MTALTCKALRIILLVFSALTLALAAIPSNEAKETFDGEDLINGSNGEQKGGHWRPPLAQQTEPIGAADFEIMLSAAKRWGEFGPEDQIGAINLITPETRTAAAALVKTGRTVTLANPMDKVKASEFVTPLEHQVFVFPPLMGPNSLEIAAGDIFTINYHGGLHSHMDGVAHFGWGGKLYNGYDFAPSSKRGFLNLGVENIAQKGIFTRGVLIDLPRMYGVDSINPGTLITLEHIEAWESLSGERVQSGDVLLLRFGRWSVAKKDEDFNPLEKTAGLHASVGAWLKERGVAAIASDAISDRMPPYVEGVFNPVHVIANYALGMPIFDHLQLDELARVSSALNQETFLFIAAPLNIEGATGSPVTPIAVF